MNDIATVLSSLGVPINSAAPVIVIVLPRPPAAGSPTGVASVGLPSGQTGDEHSAQPGRRILIDFLAWLHRRPTEQPVLPARTKVLYDVYAAQCREAGAARIPHQVFARELAKDGRLAVGRRRYRTVAGGALVQHSIALKRSDEEPLPLGNDGLVELGRRIERAEALARGLIK